MGRRKGTHYTPEFKASAVRLVVESGKSVGAAARDLGVTYGALYEWVRQAEGRPRPGHGAPTEASTPEQREIARLKAELEQVRMERDFLKNDRAPRASCAPEAPSRTIRPPERSGRPLTGASSPSKNMVRGWLRT